MKNKKVMHIVESFGSGVYSFLLDLINNTSDEFDITVLYGERPETPNNFRKNFAESVKFIKIENFTRNIDLKRDFKAIKEVNRHIKEINPDIIHLHSSKAGIIGRLIVNKKKNKVIYNPHGFSFLKQDDSRFKRKIYWLIEKIVAIVNRKCTIIGCSKGEYEEAKKLNKNSICINNGIDIRKMEQDIKKLKENVLDYSNIKICTIGRIGFQKNPKLFNQIAEKFPNIQFVWIGDGNQKKLLTSKNITITGWKERSEVLNILNDSNIFILCSLWEGLPLSLLEAMYIKKICIVSNCIGNRDVIKNNINGFVCNELEDYINAINRIKGNDKRLNGIVEEAKNDILQKYNIDNMCKQYIKLYR